MNDSNCISSHLMNAIFHFYSRQQILISIDNWVENLNITFSPLNSLFSFDLSFMLEISQISNECFLSFSTLGKVKEVC